MHSKLMVLIIVNGVNFIIKQLSYFLIIQERIKALHIEYSQPPDGSSIPVVVDENQLFYETVGGHYSMNKIYGLDSSRDIYYEPSCSVAAHFSNSSHPNREDYEKLET